MAYKPTSGASDPDKKSKEGLKDNGEVHSDLQDRRHGAYDGVNNDADVPEGLRREPNHPLNPHTGRDEKPEHVPEWKPKD
jgi:hypothetical protein